MTYQELIDQLNELEEDQLDLPVTIDFDEEYFNIKSIEIQEKDDRLSDGHPYFIV